MRTLCYCCSLLTIFGLTVSFTPSTVEKPNQQEEASIHFTENHCTSSFSGDVETYELYEGSRSVGHSIWISRQSQRAKAKYFAHKISGRYVYNRYTDWRDGKNVVLMSSGAYATGWDGSKVPAGTTVDNGIIVNKGYESRMDGLVIIYATGGIAITNIEDGDLHLASIDEYVNIKSINDRTKFLRWAQDEEATAFQTHLVIYKNALQFSRRTSDAARRKFLVLARDRSGELFHIIFYMKSKSYSLYQAAEGVLNYLHSQRMDVIAAVNLDTGGFDILGTGEGVRDCHGNFISGNTNNRSSMTNLLTYQYE